MSIFALYIHAIFLPLSTGESTSFLYLSWLRVQMFYYGFNHLAKLLNRDLATKIGWGVLFRDLMDR